MPRVSGRRVFRTDYKDVKAVISLAKRLGKGMTVYKHPNRPNYNITHSSRTDLYESDWVVYQT